MARPCKLTEPVIKKFCEAVEKGLTYDLCAKYAGISVDTFYSWKRKGKKKTEKKYVDFLKRIEQVEAHGAFWHLENIVTNARDDWKASAWILERRHNYTRYNTIESQMKEEKALSTDPKEILREQIKDLKKASDKALKMGSFQAYAALQRQQVQSVLQLRTIESENIETDTGTDDQLLHDISTMILSLPPVLRQRLEGQLGSLSAPNVVSFITSK